MHDELNGKWQDSKQCLVHDENGLFDHTLEILDNFYEEELLPLFSCSLGVSLYPTIGHYYRLWLDWVSTDHQVSVVECHLVWRKILKQWNKLSKKIKQRLGRVPLKFPSYTSIGDI